MHSAAPRAQQARCKGCFRAGISTAADVSTFYSVCSYSLSHLLSLPLPGWFCMCVHYWNKYARWVHKVTHPFLDYARFFLACALLCEYSMCQGMCGRADRPSEPLWQMKVMLRRRDARRKAGNKQADLWRTLKRTSERGEEEEGEGKRARGGGIGVSGRELFSSPYRADWPGTRSTFKCRAAQLWGLNLLPGILSASNTH